MGTYREDEAKKKTVKDYVACLWSFLVSLTGGLILVYWEYKCRLTSCQLWMVPSGLILLVTPVVIWTALVFSEICNPTDASETNQPVVSKDDLVNDTQRYLKETTEV
ncbi:hypothetical protein JCGZ_14200 [Jatropha curcas]|uniref:Uncharacterized protein n=1 Tax=Jatropha curcas TaxID=180498 RepID=A0A067K9D5_JATCU|nr:hypothetical protein JCGZ_14200 [Jatropha curcas]